MKQIITLTHVCKTYKDINAVDDVSLNIEKGLFYAIRGHSGSGKTTLLNIMGTLDNPTAGSVKVDDTDILNLQDKEKSFIRMKKIGFVFQEFYLNETFKAYENVMVPMFINPELKSDNLKDKAINILENLGLNERGNHYPNELSGGEKQRVAIARALANDPDCILADEPTGNLDKDNEIMVLKILKQLSLDGKAVVVVTHNDEVLKYADYIFEMSKGRLKEVCYEN
jgi:ABC-type lipoprotein export system ATPase subunit